MKLVHNTEISEITFELTSTEMFIELLHVDPEYRRVGEGTRLLRQTLDLADALALDVRLHATGQIPSPALVTFYQANGFVLVDDDPRTMEMLR